MNWKEVKDFAIQHNILVMKTSNEKTYEVHSIWDNIEYFNVKNPEEAMGIVRSILQKRRDVFESKNNMWGS